MGQMPLRGAGRAIHSGDPHAPQETGHLPPPNPMAFLTKQIAEHSGAGKWILQM